MESFHREKVWANSENWEGQSDLPIVADGHGCNSVVVKALNLHPIMVEGSDSILNSREGSNEIGRRAEGLKGDSVNQEAQGGNCNQMEGFSGNFGSYRF